LLNNIQISKELLSEVLEYKDKDYVIVATEKDIFLDKNYLHFEYQDPYCTPETYITIKDKINIYELAHKCKEWAISKGYILQSGYQNCICINFTDNLSKNKFSAHTEIEAIFKACEWVLKEINAK